MSTNDNVSPPEDSQRTAAVPTSRSALLGPVERGWPAEPEFEAMPESRGPRSSPSAYFHGLRRHWVLAASLGILAGGVFALAFWFGWGPSFTATAFFRIAPLEPRIVESPANRFIEGAFEIYKDTQAQFVTSNRVITAALRDPEVANIGLLKRERAKGKDPIIWLQKHLVVSFPREAEVMAVSLTDDDGARGVDIAKLVNAVVNAYQERVVNVELDERNQKASDLETACSEKEEAIRKQKTELGKLVKSVGTDDPEALRLQAQMAMQRFGDILALHSRTQIELQRVRSELRGQERLLAEVATIEIPQLDVDEYVNTHPLVRQLAGDLARQMASSAADRQYLVPHASSARTPAYADDRSILSTQIEAIGREAKEKIREKMQTDIEAKIRLLSVEVEGLEEQEKRLAADAAREEDGIRRLGISSTDLEMKRDEIKRATDVLSTLSAEKQRLDVEARSEARVRLVERAIDPTTEARKGVRIALTTLATIVGLCLPAIVVVWLDSRAQRINSAEDVSRGLGLTVLGSVPNIPARAVRQLSSPSHRHQTWHLRLTESIDSIAARLLRQATVWIEQSHAILISSAGGGEGKTTLATQLALSLARNGRRTVLVDFHLRRPAFDKVLGLPLEPGVSEVLRGQNGPAEVVHETGTDNLSVVTAGRWDRHALTALANGAAGILLDALRQDYEFIVIDSAPILPVADTRFVSQHVDAVILSVFRDVSQAPKIAAACEILEAFGVERLEAVVTGPTENLPDKDLRYGIGLPV